MYTNIALCILNEHITHKRIYEHIFKNTSIYAHILRFSICFLLNLFKIVVYNKMNFGSGSEKHLPKFI